MTALDGEVLDLSSSGIQIRLMSKPEFEQGDRCTLRIQTGSQTLRMDASFAWIKREKLFKPVWRVGLAFLDSRPSVRSLIETLAVTGYADPRRAKSKTQAGSGSQPASVHDSPSHGVADATQHGDRAGGPCGQVTIEPPDLYAILEVAPDSLPEVIQASYRSLVRRFHPDATGNEADAERFTMVSKAYNVLRDPVLRARYDARYPRAA